MKWVYYTSLHAPFAKSLRSSHTVHTHYLNFPPKRNFLDRNLPCEWLMVITPIVGKGGTAVGNGHQALLVGKDHHLKKPELAMVVTLRSSSWSSA